MRDLQLSAKWPDHPSDMYTNLARFLGMNVKSLALGVIVVMALAGGALAQDFQRPPYLTLADRPVPLDVFRVPRDRLATQDSHPFLFEGRVIDETHPRWSHFRRAIRTYPDVDPCLEEEQRGTAAPDLLAFDWNGIRYTAAIEVCLFRVFQSLRDPELIEAWVLRQGFRTSGFGDYLIGRSYMRRILSASWTPEQYGAEVMADLLLRPIWDLLSVAHSYSVTVYIGDNAQITLVGFEPNTK